MRDVRLEVRWEVDNGNGTEWASLGTQAAADAESLRDESDTRVGCDFDAQFPALDDRAHFFTLLVAFLESQLGADDYGCRTLGLHYLLLACLRLSLMAHHTLS